MTEVAFGSEAPVSVHQDPVKILYRNYRGEVAVRSIVPSRIWFGSTDWHPDPQWVLEAVDLDKGAGRSFALRDILQFDCE